MQKRLDFLLADSMRHPSSQEIAARHEEGRDEDDDPKDKGRKRMGK